MTQEPFRLPIHLPAQGAAEPEAIILQWYIAEGDTFSKGQPLAEVESAKATFEFEAPCDGTIIKIHCSQGDTIPYEVPVLEIETSDEAMKGWMPSAPEPEPTLPTPITSPEEATAGPSPAPAKDVYLRAVAGYLPERVMTTADLLRNFPEDLTDDYMYKVTGIKERRFAAEGEKPSTMALAASLAAIEKAGMKPTDVDGIILATTTPDMLMPSTACILQNLLGIGPVPAFDLNAACSGWLYGMIVARGMIATGICRNVLVVGVELQSRLLDMSDRNTCFLFGDGAGAGIVSADGPGHRIVEAVMHADGTQVHLGMREEPGYYAISGEEAEKTNRLIQLDGPGMFRTATAHFAALIREVAAKSGWTPDETRLVVPHQANGRILQAAAKRSGVPWERFYTNVEHVGNTSSASIPIALAETEKALQSRDKLILCSVGAGVTSAAVSIEW